MFFAFFAGSKSIFIIYLYIQINGPSTLIRRVFAGKEVALGD